MNDIESKGGCFMLTAIFAGIFGVFGLVTGFVGITFSEYGEIEHSDGDMSTGFFLLGVALVCYIIAKIRS